MRHRMERFVLLPLGAGCISETSIAVAPKQAKRSKLDINSTPTGIHQGEKEIEENEYDDDGESLSAENLKSPLSLPALPGVQKLFKNFKNLSQLFVYKDDLEETDMGMEIGLPTDVKHVTHIGVDGCATSILSKGWNNPNQPKAELMNLASFPLPPLELADRPAVRSLLETK